MGSNMMDMMGGQGSWGMGFGMIGVVIFWVLVIALVVVLVVVLARGALGSGASPPQRREKTALDILKERYARGDIERPEFEQKKRDLGG